MPEGSAGLFEGKSVVQPHLARLATRLAGVEEKPAKWRYFPFLGGASGRNRQLKTARATAASARSLQRRVIGGCGDLAQHVPYLVHDRLGIAVHHAEVRGESQTAGRLSGRCTRRSLCL